MIRNGEKDIFKYGGSEEGTKRGGDPRGHRRTTRTRRPQIRYHLATTDVICMRVSPLRHRTGKREKRKEPRERGKEKSILSSVPTYTLYSSVSLPTFADLRSRRSVDNAIVPRYFIFFSPHVAPSLSILRINLIAEIRPRNVTRCWQFVHRD